MRKSTAQLKSGKNKTEKILMEDKTVLKKMHKWTYDY